LVYVRKLYHAAASAEPGTLGHFAWISKYARTVVEEHAVTIGVVCTHYIYVSISVYISGGKILKLIRSAIGRVCIYSSAVVQIQIQLCDSAVHIPGCVIQVAVAVEVGHDDGKTAVCFRGAAEQRVVDRKGGVHPACQH
jgi:hypothetical protein